MEVVRQKLFHFSIFFLSGIIRFLTIFFLGSAENFQFGGVQVREIICWSEPKTADPNRFRKSNLDAEILSLADVNIHTVKLGFLIIEQIFVCMIGPIIRGLWQLNF